MTTLFEDRNGVIWCGTARGLYRLEEQNGHLGFRFIEVGKTTELTSIIEDRHGTLWIGSTNGLFRFFPDGRVERYRPRVMGLPDVTIHSLLEIVKVEYG